MRIGDQIKPITYLKNRTAELVREVSESGRPVVITQNGTAKVVVVDVAAYDRWRSALALLKMVAQSEDQVAKGQVSTQAEALQRAEAAIRRAQDA